MKLAILDDWFNTLRNLPCFAKLDGLDVTVFNDHEANALLNALNAGRPGSAAIDVFDLEQIL